LRATRIGLAVGGRFTGPAARQIESMPTRSKLLLAAEATVFLGALAVSAIDSEAADWRPPGLVLVLLALTVASDALAVRHKSQRISGSFLGLVLAMALLGPAPAVAIGVVATLLDQVRTRLPRAQLITNLATYATFPLIGALLIERLAASTDFETDNLTFALVVFGAFMVANGLNFLMIAGDYAFHNGVPVSRQLRTIFIPVLPSSLVSALLTVSVAVLYREVGLAALGLFALVLIVFQFLLRALLLSQRRAEELASLQLGVLTSLVETLALRDRMTARHSAAVARYASALAGAAGGSKDEQELAHTAGLLHDIGKFSFPDSILHAQRPLDEEQWEIVRRHPEAGAQVVRRMEAYGPVAEIILRHHENWDGGGYPEGVAGLEIPRVSRIISIADAYDVMTARDSYRRPMSSYDAIAELRHFAGSQFDPELVEVFVALLESKGLAFRHADDADFETELAFERRVREYARRGRIFA
jgi:putative nucleotidyltransferase with HDIG domain